MADFNAATVKVHQLLMKLSQEPLLDRAEVVKDLASQGARPQEIEVFIKARKEGRNSLWLSISVIAQAMASVDRGKDHIEALEHAVSMQRLAFDGEISDDEAERLVRSLISVFH